MMISSPSTSTFSMGISVSAPFGIREPVKVLIHVPPITSSFKAEPAGFILPTFNVPKVISSWMIA